MDPLEEGTDEAIDFTKVARVASGGVDVVPVVLQHAETKDVLFVGYASPEALAETLATKKAVLWSTSRKELWRKGATSGDELWLEEVRVNCEQNALVYVVRPATGGVCHTVGEGGRHRPTCFYRRLLGDRLAFLDEGA